MPVWFIAAPVLKLVVFLWQVSQAAVVAMWVAGLAFTVVKLPPWQVAQPVVMPVWFITAGLKAVVDLWQVSQAAVVGICVAALSLAVVPLWQLEQPALIPV